MYHEAKRKNNAAHDICIYIYIYIYIFLLTTLAALRALLPTPRPADPWPSGFPAR